MYLLGAFVAALLALTVLVRWIEPRLAFFPFSGESETPRDFGVPFEATTVETRDGERLRAWIMRARASGARMIQARARGPRARRLLPRQWREPVELGADPRVDRAARLLGVRLRLSWLRCEHRPSDRARPVSRRGRGGRARVVRRS